MFARMARKIRRLPLWVQVFVWPVFLIVRVVCGALGWAASEMGSQATSGAKKILRPLLWPAAGFAVIAFTAVTLGPQRATQMLAPVVVFGVLALLVWSLAFGPKPKRKKRKKR